MITFLAPAWRCLEAVAVSRKMPVDSTTTPTPSSFHGSAAGSFWAQTRASRPLTKMASPLACTSAARAPWTESCLSRCASVLASARSLTPTTSMSFDSRAVRKKTRPMRPNPLTPTRMLMEGLLVETADRRSQQLESIIRPLSGHGQPSGRRYGRPRPRAAPARTRRASRRSSERRRPAGRGGPRPRVPPGTPRRARIIVRRPGGHARRADGGRRRPFLRSERHSPGGPRASRPPRAALRRLAHRHRDAAAVAVGRDDAGDRVPARPAQGVAAVRAEPRLAHRAEGREYEIERRGREPWEYRERQRGQPRTGRRGVQPWPDGPRSCH